MRKCLPKGRKLEGKTNVDQPTSQKPSEQPEPDEEQKHSNMEDPNTSIKKWSSADDLGKSERVLKINHDREL